jgi:hypothetical protein
MDLPVINEQVYEGRNFIIKMIIAGAFYPNYFNSNPFEIENAQHPTTFNLKKMIMVSNFPNNEGIFYQQQLIEIFSICSATTKMHPHYKKVFIEFQTYYEQMSSNINLPVYLAVLMRKSRRLRIKQFTEEVIYEKSRKLKTSADFNSHLGIILKISKFKSYIC